MPNNADEKFITIKEIDNITDTQKRLNDRLKKLEQNYFDLYNRFQFLSFFFIAVAIIVIIIVLIF